MTVLYFHDINCFFSCYLGPLLYDGFLVLPGIYICAFLLQMHFKAYSLSLLCEVSPPYVDVFSGKKIVWRFKLLFCLIHCGGTSGACVFPLARRVPHNSLSYFLPHREVELEAAIPLVV